MSSDISAQSQAIVGESSTTDSGDPNANDGFFSSLIGSVFEPGVNKSLFMAMNLSFLLLEVTLLGLAFLTQWNWHVLFLAVVSLGLWGGMVWFVHEITSIQSSSQNQPPSASTPIVPPSIDSKGDSDVEEDIDQDTEVVKSDVEVGVEESGLRSRSTRKR